MAAGLDGAGILQMRVLYPILLDVRITAGRCRTFSSLTYAHHEYIYEPLSWEAVMPILQALGPSNGASLIPPKATGPSALRLYGVLPMPSLEWQPQVERETAHLYER